MKQTEGHCLTIMTSIAYWLFNVTCSNLIVWFYYAQVWIYYMICDAVWCHMWHETCCESRINMTIQYVYCELNSLHFDVYFEFDLMILKHIRAATDNCIYYRSSRQLFFSINRLVVYTVKCPQKKMPITIVYSQKWHQIACFVWNHIYLIHSGIKQKKSRTFVYIFAY